VSPIHTVYPSGTKIDESHSYAIGSAPPEYLLEIGRVVVEWALLEAVAHNELRRLLGLDSDPELYSAVQPRTAKALFESLGKVAKRKLDDEEKLKSLRMTLKAIEKADTGVLARRNRVNHSVWLHPAVSDGLPATKKSADIFVDSIESQRSFPLEDLKRLADEISKRCWEIKFCRPIYEESATERSSRRK
jgi:hypothetical protein